MSRTRSGEKSPDNTPEAQSRRALLAVLLWVVTAALSAWCMRLPAARGVEAPTNLFSAGRVLAEMEELARGLGPRPMGSAANLEFLQRLETHLEWLGLETEHHEEWVVGPYGTIGRPRNLIVRQPGVASLAPILVMAHHDSVGAGVGAADDLAGVAALCEVARLVKSDRVPGREVIFLFTDGEESGLLGAASFARNHPDGGRIGAVVNLEARGTRGPSYLFETGPGNKPIIELFRGMGSPPTASSVSVEIYKRMPNDTDFSVFRERGVPGANFAFIGDVAAYHTPLDDFERLDPRSLQHQGESVLGLVRALRAHEGELGGADSVHGALLGTVEFVYPVRWGFPLSLGALILVVLGSWRAVRRGRARWWGIFAGAILPISTLVVGSLAAGGLGGLVATLIGDSSPWRASPAWGWVAVWGVVVLSVGLSAALARRLADSVSLHLGTALSWGLVGMGVSVFAPGASYLALVPALSLGLLFNVVRLRDAAEARFARITLFVLPLTVATWDPAWTGARAAFGLTATGLAAAVPLLFATLLVPVLSATRSSVGVLLVGVGALLVSVGGAATFVMPLRTEAHPARVNLGYTLDGDEAVWTVHTAGARFPGELMDEQPFAPSSREAHGHGPSTRFEAPAPLVDVGGATFEVLSTSTDERGALEVEGLLKAGEGALLSRFGVTCSVPYGVLRARVAGLDTDLPATIVGPGPEGIPVSLTLIDGEALAALIAEEEGEGGDGTQPDAGTGVDPGEGEEAGEPEPITFSAVLTDVHAGLPPEGSSLLDARPPDCVPSHRGDVTTVKTRVPLAP